MVKSCQGERSGNVLIFVLILTLCIGMVKLCGEGFTYVFSLAE